MPLGYDTNGYVRGEGGNRAAEGDYDFKIDHAEEVTFKTGSRGLKVELLVGAFDTRDIRVFENLAYSNAARWRIDQFLTALGFDFMHPPEAHDLVGRMGRGHFAPNERGYLEVKEYFEPEGGARPAPSGGGYNYGPPPMSGDDVPF